MVGKEMWINKLEEDDDSSGLVITEKSTTEFMDFSIQFDGVISNETVNPFLYALEEKIDKAIRFELDYEIKVPICVYINSPGGYVTEGFRAIRAIEQSPIPVHTIADGLIASMAGPLLISGKKRFSYPKTTFLIHGLSAGYMGKYGDIKDWVSNLDQTHKDLVSFFCSKTKISLEKMEELQKREYYFEENQAVEFGIVDEILTYETTIQKERVI